MRIALVLNSFPKTSETFILNKITELAKRGQQITVFTHSVSAESSIIDTSFSKNIEIKQIFGLGNKIKYAVKGLILSFKKPSCFSYLKTANGNIISNTFRLGVLAELGEYPIVHFEFSGLAVNYFSQIQYLTSKTKVIISCRGSAELIAPLFHKDRKLQLVSVLDSAYLVHCVSDHIRQTLINYGLTNENVKVIRPATNELFFTFNPINRKPNEVLKVLMVGRLDWVKGFDLVLLAIQKIVEKGNLIELSIIGSGDEERKLKFLSYVLKIDHHVKFLGSKSSVEVKKKLMDSHILLLPSWSEGISNTAIEAKFSGVAVISTKSGGMEEVLVHKQSGYLIELGDIKGIQEGIEYFYKHENSRMEIIQNARKDAILYHSLKSQIDEFENIYNHI
jgi:colanic acid/amylovoran biosynthesis glycosyltransferase